MSRKSQMSKIREHFNRTSGGNAGKYMKIEAPNRGEKTIVKGRILPPWPGEKEGFFYYYLATHYGFKIGGRDTGISCPESVGRGKCVINEFIAKLQDSDSKAHGKIEQRIYARKAYYVNFLDYKDNKIKILRLGKRVIEKIFAKTDKGVDVTDPRKGRDITITRVGRGFKDTRYKHIFSKVSTKVDYDESEMHKLDQIVPTWMDYKTMKGYLVDNYGEEMRQVGMSTKIKRDADDDTDDNVKTVRKKKSVKNKKKPRVVEDDEDDVDYSEIDEDDFNAEDLEEFEDEE